MIKFEKNAPFIHSENCFLKSAQPCPKLSIGRRVNKKKKPPGAHISYILKSAYPPVLDAACDAVGHRWSWIFILFIYHIKGLAVKFPPPENLFMFRKFQKAVLQK